MPTVRSSTLSRLAGAFAAIWLCCTGSAWAGGGGAGDVGNPFQSSLGVPNGANGLCSSLAMTSCPQLPALTQLVLEYSGLLNSPPNSVRNQAGGLDPENGVCNVAGAILSKTPNLPLISPCDLIALNAVNPPVATPPGDPSRLVPLGFGGPLSATGTALPVATGATSSFYAVASAASGQPDMLSLFYIYPLTTTTFPKGQQVAAVSFPLAILNSDGTERPIIATLQLNASSNCTVGVPSCLTPTVSGNFSGGGTQKALPSDLGMSWTLTPSQQPPKTATLQVQAPLLVTGPTKSTESACAAAISNSATDVTDCGNDPAYFGVGPFVAGTNGTNVNPNIGAPTLINQVSGFPTAFTSSVIHPVTFLKGAIGAGIPPYAAPTAPPGTPIPPPTSTSSFGFCASFWGGDPSIKTLNPAVAAFLSVGTDGTTYVSAAVSSGAPPSSTFKPIQLTCPF